MFLPAMGYHPHKQIHRGHEVHDHLSENFVHYFYLDHSFVLNNCYVTSFGNSLPASRQVFILMIEPLRGSQNFFSFRRAKPGAINRLVPYGTRVIIFLTSNSGNNLMKCALINLPSNNLLYSSLPLASLYGEISVRTISINSCMTSSDNFFPLKNADVFFKKIGIGPTPPAEIAASFILSPFISIAMAEFTLAISRLVLLLTFSKLNLKFFDGASNQIFAIYSSGRLSSCL